MEHEDRDLQRRVQAALDGEPGVEAGHIGVAAEDGIVTLSGHVGSRAEKLAAERVARRIRGVKGIAQEIEIRCAAAAAGADDTEIARQAVGALAWDALIPPGRVLVRVEKGWVSLSGEVEWRHQSAAAERAVQRLGGVVGVVNQIRARREPLPRRETP